MIIVSEHPERIDKHTGNLVEIPGKELSTTGGDDYSCIGVKSMWTITTMIIKREEASH